MSNFLSGRQRELKVGISSFTENKTTLSVIGNANIIGIITALSFSGNASSASYSALAGIATYALTSGVSTYAVIAGVSTISTYASTSGVSTSATFAITAGYASTAGIATYAGVSGVSNYATNAGVATYAPNAGIATYASTAGIANSATNSELFDTQLPSYYLNYNNLTNTPTIPSLVGYATVAYVDDRFNTLIGGAPAALDTLNELATALNDDANFASTVTNNLALKANLSGAAFTGTVTAPTFSGSFSGNATSATFATSAGIATNANYATNAGIATYAPVAGVSTYAIIAGISTNVIGGIASITQLSVSGVSTLNIVASSNIFSTGIVTASGGFSLGISSGGTTITSGPVTALNFVGTGNTFAINGTTVDISIAGGGGASVSISTTPPTSPTEGDLWYSSIIGRTFIYYNDGSSSQWVDSSPFNIPEPDPTPGKTTGSFTATAGQTSFSYAYKPGFIDVFLNGIRLNSTEFIANNGTSIVLLESASLGDVLDVVEYTMGIGSTGPQGTAGPLSGVATITTNATYYPLFVSGIGSVNPHITTANDYFEFNPSSGTLFTNQLSITGVCTALDFNSTSDKNLKYNIQTIENPIEKVLQINGISFEWKNTNEKSAGVIAQEVELVMPEIIKNNDGTKTVNYNGLVGLLIESVKNQQEQINILKEEIRLLKEK